MKPGRSFLCCLIFGLAAQLFAGPKIQPRLGAILESLSPSDLTLAWILFTDKGSQEVFKSAVPHTVVSQRSFQRRLKSRPFDSAVDYTDLPVEKSYVDRIAEYVSGIRQISKWFNGVSVSATRDQLTQLESLPFVARIELLTQFKRNRSEEVDANSKPEPPTEHQDHQTNDAFSLDYGLSFNQLSQINVPAVHATGNYGQGVIVGSFDNGFRLLNHEAFDSLRTHIVGTYDFVDHKVSVVPNNPATNFGAHGVATLSALGGYKPGELIGPAFGASYILARTENDSSETPLEEDNWVAAIEWADSLGVDVTSTSLGYLTYDPPYSWTWQNMDGNTTVITRAADMAVSKGIVVVNSAGNNGFDLSHNTLNAPADGDSVLSIGAVSMDGVRVNFSSVGPTTSFPPRIKPDVMAQGVFVRSASPTDPAGYADAQGTSLSCPLAAGVAALVIHANPNASAVEIMNAMRQTASRASSPDREYGWGILNAMNAVSLVSGGGSIPTTYRLLQNFPNPFNPFTTIELDLPKVSFVSLNVYDILGQQVRTLVDNKQLIGRTPITWRGENNGGSTVATGVYFARLTARSVDGTSRYASTIKLVFLR